ncbi:hypothetical protein dsx2_3438, partial [Desulfovibrio sp. X2]|uniref:hypothetical protein n=1 Tax=Desulfovibrio sp. X2 TaxID=941449 RepID=UPI000358AF3D
AALWAVSPLPVRAARAVSRTASTPTASARAASTQAAPAADESCPLTAPTYRAELEKTSYEARAGKPFTLRVRLTPPAPPPGFFVTVNVERAAGPEGGPENGRVESLPGYPDTDVTCSLPGDYRLAVTVALVAKSSCGGVKAATLLEREITVRAR